jgi:DNA-binding NarL/FixJ family response regulator
VNAEINIVIVEDQYFQLESFVGLLSTYQGLHFVGKFSNGVELLDWLKGCEKLPDLILLDIRMKFMDGKETLKRIRSKYSHLKTVMLSEHYENEIILELIRGGANGYLSKNSRPETIVHTIRKVHKEVFCFDPFIIKLLAKGNPFELKELTEDEMNERGLSINIIKVIRGVLDGKKSEVIAGDVGLGRRGVEDIRRKIWAITKCEPNNIPQLFEYAFRNGLIAI